MERLCEEDRDVYIFDMYNASIYPQDQQARKRIDLDVPLTPHTADQTYLSLLEDHLPVAIQEANPRLAFYNAGTDIYDQDPLGGLDVSAEGVFQRDRMVIEALREANIPCVMVLSGGYSQESFRLISRTVGYILDQSSGA